MIPILRRPSPPAARRPAKRLRGTHVGVVIVRRDLDEEHFTAAGVCFLAKDASFVARGTVLQDHITQDPVSLEARSVCSTSRHKKGSTYFRDWVPPVAVPVLRSFPFDVQPALKDIYMCTYVCILVVLNVHFFFVF